MNAIARFFATLTGQDYVYEATVANYDYAESVKEAQKANEGALASFDKLNVIAKSNADNNTLALNKDTVTYKKVKIDPEDKWYTRLAKKIAEGWKNADLSGATHDIAEAISLADTIIVFSKRPAHIKNVYDIKLNNKTNPINNRSDERFFYYYNLLWKDLDKYDE